MSIDGLGSTCVLFQRRSKVLSHILNCLMDAVAALLVKQIAKSTWTTHEARHIATPEGLAEERVPPRSLKYRRDRSYRQMELRRQYAGCRTRCE
jgi:hypothetical protein